MTEQEWLECGDPNVLLKWLQRSKRHQTTGRKMRLFSCACCRRIEHLLSEHDREAVEIAEGYADGLVNAKTVEEMRNNLRFEDTAAAEYASRHAAVSWSLWLPSMTYSEITRAETAASSVAGYAAMTMEREVESSMQCDLLRDIISNPFRTVVIDPRWLTSTVVDLATAIYDERTFDRLPILADALMDAGCDSEEIISHCRSEGPHVRGCWAVDLLLGKD